MRPKPGRDANSSVNTAELAECSAARQGQAAAPPAARACTAPLMPILILWVAPAAEGRPRRGEQKRSQREARRRAAAEPLWPAAHAATLYNRTSSGRLRHHAVTRGARARADAQRAHASPA